MSKIAALDVLATGVNTVDVLVQLPDLYAPGEKRSARDLAVQGGGLAATAACVLGALGWRTGFITRLSDDALSTISRAEFKRYGVVDDFFIDDPARTALALPDGTGRLGRCPGCARSRWPKSSAHP
jgi:sugar/nucleoside kinase (ribokinase family)